MNKINQKTRSKGASLLKLFQTVKAARHYLQNIPDVRRNQTLLFFPLKIISVRDLFRQLICNHIKLCKRYDFCRFGNFVDIHVFLGHFARRVPKMLPSWSRQRWIQADAGEPGFLGCDRFFYFIF